MMESSRSVVGLHLEPDRAFMALPGMNSSARRLVSAGFTPGNAQDAVYRRDIAGAVRRSAFKLAVIRFAAKGHPPHDRFLLAGATRPAATRSLAQMP
jgi:hypothetical protein